MSSLTLLAIKLGYLAVLWLFVLSSVSVIRTDIFGARTTSPKSKKAKSAKTKPLKKSKRLRGKPKQLIIIDGPNQGQSVPLGTEPILLGRGTDAAIRLNDDYVSTRHTRFATNGEQWFVEDLGSTNGTYIGNQRVSNPVPIAVGVPVRLGKTIVELRP
ncbi:MAG: FHA domain-containing protein [Actinomycetales bacterium]|nr:FHA domain-containing protein [Actinomycetales bacterium]